jgi:hypothetical protein
MGFGEGRIVGRERTLGAIEFINESLVQAEIIDDGETIVGRHVDGVRVRRFLALGIESVAGVLNEGGSFSELAVVENRKYRDASAGVVGDQNEFSRSVDHQVARVGAAGGDFIQ